MKERLGVWWVHSGTEDSSGGILVAGEGPDAYWGAEPVDVAELATRPAAEGWDGRLVAAIAVLGVTPTQDQPRWLVFPSYG